MGHLQCYDYKNFNNNFISCFLVTLRCLEISFRNPAPEIPMTKMNYWTAADIIDGATRDERFGTPTSLFINQEVNDSSTNILFEETIINFVKSHFLRDSARNWYLIKYRDNVKLEEIQTSEVSIRQSDTFKNSKKRNSNNNSKL
ncbi:hypothetical protein H8356DRAFT_1347426 [Neocallimastix lanati (nom. inval.)]|nr:hypothetical protein H8356DRAFT_1347426 [Neocallimastix sp. JGI-2020a]